MKIKLITTIFFALAFTIANAQLCYETVSLTSIPESPCPGDEVFLVALNSFCSICDCESDSLSINHFSNPNTTAEVYYYGSECEMICSGYDTISIGTMPNGDWTFNYDLFIDDANYPASSTQITIENCNTFNPSLIDTAYILQENICEGDSLQMVVTLYTSAACNCSADSSFVNLFSTVPQLNTYYSFGLCLATCTSTDTLEIGAWEAGNYTLQYNAILTDYPPAINIANYFVDFMVEDCINNNDVVLDNNIELYPNPTENLFQIEGLIGNYNIQILDVAGNVYQTINTNQTNYTIDLSSLPSGIFLVSIKQVDNSNVILEKIIKY